eukprot:CAMPEP_0170192238 /NCGR_PEP_ID=MMETSP0040_2-20121228/53669_1 /TAXON_ID=641309 /ORGANISM="Lotharella oceanica, Strain CCMP622" /LENGTH=109 /DNA_ID=CAMNT_0010440535 /DNA_START=8 /DNA_END=337 /DNA_ORIENTATION=+
MTMASSSPRKKLSRGQSRTKMMSKGEGKITQEDRDKYKKEVHACIFKWMLDAIYKMVEASIEHKTIGNFVDEIVKRFDMPEKVCEEMKMVQKSLQQSADVIAEDGGRLQ